MKYLLPLFLLIVAHITFGQDKKIKKMTVIQVLGDYKNDSIFPQDTISGEQYTLYDLNGKKLLWYRLKDNVIDTNDYYRYYFNDIGLLSKSVYYHGDGKYSWKFYSYDKNDNLIKIVADRLNGRQSFIKLLRYDKYGSLIQSKEIFDDGTKSKIKYINKYEGGKLVKVITKPLGKSPNPNNLSLEHNYIKTKNYDEGILVYSKSEEINGNRVFEDFYNEKGEQIKHCIGKVCYDYEHYYNENSDLKIKLMRYNSSFGRIWVYSYEYY